MIRLQDVDLVDACRYKVGRKGVTPYSGLGFRVRGLSFLVTFLVNFFQLLVFSFMSVFYCFASQRARVGNLRSAVKCLRRLSP